MAVRKKRSSVPTVRYNGSPRIPPPPSIRNSWLHFAWLVATAIALYYAKGPILIIAAIVGIGWLCNRYPTFGHFVAVFVRGFISGLIGGRRRRW
jgi:hypothetical protein